LGNDWRVLTILKHSLPFFVLLPSTTSVWYTLCSNKYMTERCSTCGTETYVDFHVKRLLWLPNFNQNGSVNKF
jgi:hypothetical protein